MDRAGAALSNAAAVFGAGQAQRVAQHPQQRGVRIDIDIELLRMFVDGETEHWRPPRSGSRPPTKSVVIIGGSFSLLHSSFRGSVVCHEDTLAKIGRIQQNLAPSKSLSSRHLRYLRRHDARDSPDRLCSGATLSRR